MLKNNYNLSYIKRLADDAIVHFPGFDRKDFEQKAGTGLDKLEMKARIAQIGEAFFDAFGRDFKQMHRFGQNHFGFAAAESKSVWQTGIIYDPMAYIIEQYGLDHFDESIFLIKEITMRFTSEFAIRNLMFEKTDETLVVLEDWAKSDNEHLRRLASEGSRTRLPWGRKLHNLINEPRKTRNILETLKADPSRYVQTSVANHLNDISKDHPDYFYEIVTDWSKKKHPSTQWIIKHALRNEIKKGDDRALKLLGYNPVRISTLSFELSPNQVKLGESILLQAELRNEENKPVDFVLDFGIHLVKSNGNTFFKVFKWKNQHLEVGQCIKLEKKYQIKKVTTRVYHPGKHQVDLLINGKTQAVGSFQLKL